LTNFLFLSSTSSDDCPTFGWQSPDQALWGVKEGFKNAADDLVKKALREGKKNNIRVFDTYIFPIMYLYRQSLEVSLKNIYLRCFGKIPGGGHDLSIIWKKVNQEIIKDHILNEEFLERVKLHKQNFYKFSLKGIDFSKITQVFIEIQQFDSKADVFRYMVDKNGKTYFNQNQYIDYKNLKTVINEIYENLDYIHQVIDEYMSS
jgi:hypothetical protein